MTTLMRRREFAPLLGAAVVAWPLAARAQQVGQMRRVGVLMNNGPTNQVYQSYMTTFTRALQTLGWKDGVDKPKVDTPIDSYSQTR
jgi:putative tryptophan/tyrosine transport system substrate-binding protein